MTDDKLEARLREIAHEYMRSSYMTLTDVIRLAAEAGRQAAGEDTARLDWLDKRMEVETGRLSAPVYVVDIPMHDCPDDEDANLRAAVDAARAREGGSEG